MLQKFNPTRNVLLSGTAILAMANLIYAPIANAIVPTDEVGPEDSVDTDGGVNGVGMFFRADGFVCSGTLINPRTVLFAAHCVNNVPESAFGSTLPAAWSFNVDALPGFQTWFGNGFQTDVDANVFNVNQLFYNEDSLANPAARGFLEADIALASLDTPAASIPTWALLFSALPAPDTLTNATGTGYHVNITGYGSTGDGGFTGDNIGVDFRRRAAENFLGALTSINNRTDRLAGAPLGTFDDDTLPQNLYWTDFDAPNGDDLFFDFNNYLDDALPNEGTTAGGDSGGPLILDAANNEITDRDIVIGVLSGGSSFFNPRNSFGSSSLYQPLFAFYDYIAATNPYRYVSALEGDGNWEDASHWVTDTDPNYFIFDENNALVNGLPDTPEEGRAQTDGDFGAICVQGFAGNLVDGDDCLDTSTGEYFSAEDDLADGDNVQMEGNEPVAALSNNAARLSDDFLAGVGLGLDTNQIGLVNTNFEQVAINTPTVTVPDARNNVTAGPVEATLENGRAGATGFVPNNIERNDAAGVSVRYFDVTLAADGATTLSSAVTIDKLTLNGAGARLNVAEGASLTSLIDVEQLNGWVDVNGQINSVGDYLLMSGMLTGTGTITTPFLTNIMGGIAPGGMGEIGTLTIDGGAVLASASGLLVDIGANGVSDVLNITGDSSLGGTVTFAPTADVRNGNQYTFVRTGGTQSGEFSAAQITPLLNAALSYTENTVVATIEAGSFQDAIIADNAVQGAYANLLDGGRGAESLAPIFATLDLSTTESIQSVLDSWAPVAETSVRSLAKTTVENVAHFHRDRMDHMTSSNWGGKMTVMGNPVQMASNVQYATVMSDVAVLQASNGDTVRTTANIPSEYEIFLSGAFIDGSGSAMPTAQNFADEDFDGFSITGGVERAYGEKVTVGVSASYTSLDAEVSLGQSAETDHFAGTLYAQARSDSNVVLDGALSLGSLGTKTSRTVAFPSNASLTTEDDSGTFTGDLRVSKIFKYGKANIVPRASLTTSKVSFETVDEAGGLPGLSLERKAFTSTQGRLGLGVNTTSQDKVQLHMHADLVGELANIDEDFDANFVGLSSQNSAFALFGTDKTWGELGAGIDFDLENVRVSISADTTVGRSDLEARTYRAGLSYKF